MSVLDELGNALPEIMVPPAKQDSNTSDLLFSVAYLVSYISRSTTLLPGDVILTGTPGGVGPIAAGDTVEIELSGVGVLSNPVTEES